MIEISMSIGWLRSLCLSLQQNNYKKTWLSHIPSHRYPSISGPPWSTIPCPSQIHHFTRSCQTIIFTNLENIKTLKQLQKQKKTDKQIITNPCIAQVLRFVFRFVRFPCNSPLFAEILWSQPPWWQEQELQPPTLPTAPAVALRPRAAASHYMWSLRAEPPECR